MKVFELSKRNDGGERMKSVLISIQPYWVFLIIAKTMGWNVDKEKTVEVRKTFPKDENWNKVAKIYCSKDKNSFAKIPSQYKPLMEQFLGKVIGEFVCNKVEISFVGYNTDGLPSYWDILDGSCLTPNELVCYGEWKPLYGWHISDLVIYDKPKGLHHFFKPCGDCDKKGTRRCTEELTDCRAKVITRPPQSWCYVENDFKE